MNNRPLTGNTEEPLDLADLDLSRLRLSKKDLETLSNIAPGLPKCFQEQLLAKLPPTQARKLSRTLSVQTNQNCSLVQVHKRSQSSGRNVAPTIEAINKGDPSSIRTAIEKNTDDMPIEKASVKISHSANKGEIKGKSSGDDSKELKPLQNSDINDKYKYYSPYVTKNVKESFQKITSKVPPSETTSNGSTLGRPPSGRVSPPSTAEIATKRPTQRRVSRLIRPDFLDIVHIEEISADQNQTLNSDKTENIASDSSLKAKSSRHIRNKSVELSLGCEKSNSSNFDSSKYNRRSLSRSRDLEERSAVDKSKLADKILQELQLLSSMRSRELDNIQEKNTTENMPVEKPASPVKKIKKVKNKEKSTESSTDGDLKNSNTLVKKVKKIVKKSEAQNTTTVKKLSGYAPENSHGKPAEICDISSPKKASKLKRPKSYPMKDSVSTSNASEMCSTPSEVLDANNISTTECVTSPPSFATTDITSTACVSTRESRILRPKSYPSSKLVAPKESKQLVSKQVSGIEESLPSISSQKSDFLTSSSAKLNKNLPSSSQIPEAVSSDAKKVVKLIKKKKVTQLNSTSAPTTTTPNTTSSPGDELNKDSNPAPSVPLKEKVIEKKPNRGLLYAIGQKFEKLRASATSNSCANIPSNKKVPLETASSESLLKKAPEVKKTKSLCETPHEHLTRLEKKSIKVMNKDRDNAVVEHDAKPTKNEKRSRIDAMIRNLRERSIPRSHRTISSESNYIKRAVSVEEMPGTFNKKSVNKVLGLFKRYEKDASSENRVRNARSTSNIEREVSKPSPIYQNANVSHGLNKKIEKCNSSGVISNDTNNPIKSSKKINETPIAGEHHTCPGCFTSAENSQDKRKGLMLELVKPEKFQPPTKTFTNSRLSKRYPCYNDNEIYSNISPHNKYIYNPSVNISKAANAENFSNNNNNISSFLESSGSASCNNTNNNNCNNNNNNNSSSNHYSSLHTSQTSGYRTSSTHEIAQNNNLLSPSFENIGNYSSDSRSFQEDCASTSNFLSPTEEAELCFDSWSVCSEDNYRGQRATPSPTVSHLSRASQASSPTRRGDNSEAAESVVDRIKRRSFYCRFNEKKPKRTSSIVGPNAVREYYREKSSSSKPRASTKNAPDSTGDREHSPDITQEFFRPLKLSPIGTELKPPVYRSSFSGAHDYSAAAGRPRKSLNDIRTPTSPSCLSERRHTAFTTAENDIVNNASVFPPRYKSNTYDETPKATGAPSNLYSYNTYNPKRRFSFTTNSGISAVSNNGSQIEGYATLGRRPIRSYEHRTMSLLDSSSHPNTYRHDSVVPSSTRDYTTSLSRSNSRYRKSSTPRSPTNI